ncbi:sulfite exporter TauE/SafE family protein [Reyranella sp.]|uniref:sulfite exporter TauE/SafE family protein n=1 Tax=Reyranella sp. TaxID=1929291 RepID=UPI003D13D3B9
MTTEHILLALAVFLIAGVVKGLVGMGLPTITIALTSLVLPLSDTIALIALPTIFTNLWQAAVGGKFWLILRRQWPLILPLGATLYLTMWAVGRKAPEWAFLVLAIVLVVYSVLGLFRVRLHIHADLEKPLAPVIGVISGFVAGLVGVPVIPLMPYLQALDIKPTELVQTLGVVLCATSVTLTVSLLRFGLLDGPHAVVSAIAVAPAIAGMWIGTQVRLKLSIEQFRLAVLWALLLTGLYTFASRLL